MVYVTNAELDGRVLYGWLLLEVPLKQNCTVWMVTIQSGYNGKAKMASGICYNNQVYMLVGIGVHYNNEG